MRLPSRAVRRVIIADGCGMRRVYTSGTQAPSHTSGRTVRPVRLSSVYNPTLPAAATDSLDTIDSLKLLLRGGYVRQSASGTYSYLPAGLRMLNKITRIIDEEMESIGASRIEMPQLLPSALWHKTGRVQVMGSELFRFKDRRGTEMILAPTHEEEVTKLVGADVESHRALPVRVYQIGRKFRDEPRPRAGLLRTKEFLMKDMYSFDLNVAAAKQAYADVRGAYARIFDRIFDWSASPLPPTTAPTWREAEADTGAMGGTFSHEFHVEDSIGEDTVLSCDNCTYAANVECAASAPPPERIVTSMDDAQVVLWATAHDTAHVVALVLPASATLNPLVVAHERLEPLPAEVRGAHIRVVRDTAVEIDDTAVRAAVARAAESVAPASISEQVDTAMLRTADAGDMCGACMHGHLHEHRAMEIGHTFLLGTRYTEALGYRVAEPGSNERVPLQMGCYGIGVTRILGALAQRAMHAYQALHPNASKGKRARVGFVWPHTVAPFEALVLPAVPHSPEKLQAAERLCASLDAGVSPTWREASADNPATLCIPAREIALDDRADRTLGSSLFDAELAGYPIVFLLGKHWEQTGEVEVRRAGRAPQYATFAGVHP
ncbi:proline--tRNA ligase [Malassezia brasiliensis]|uniref:proline--tRNA ligase n=1 Tax=Malassezia brasiliensis TaxID=1821822 RepID=A0AAF0DTK1_9BASI|nr:proline--tRNA ligase [Malassezia brasiliensis]